MLSPAASRVRQLPRKIKEFPACFVNLAKTWAGVISTKPGLATPRTACMTVKPESSVVHPTQPSVPEQLPAAGTRPRRAHRPSRLPKLLSQLVTFGLVGGTAFVVDVGVYNLLRFTVLDDKPIGAKVISVAVATIVAWLGNRALTFRTEHRRAVWKEGALFALMNVLGLGIAAGCLYVSHYVLGYTTALADNIAGNGVGLVLGMVFRFLAYRYVVFRPAESATDRRRKTSEQPAPEPRPAASTPSPVSPTQTPNRRRSAPTHALPTSGGLS